MDSALNLEKFKNSEMLFYFIKLVLYSFIAGTVVVVGQHVFYRLIGKDYPDSILKSVIFTASIVFIALTAYTVTKGRISSIDELFSTSQDPDEGPIFTKQFHIDPNIDGFEQIVLTKDTIINNYHNCAAIIGIWSIGTTRNREQLLSNEFVVEFSTECDNPYSNKYFLVDSVSIAFGIDSLMHWLKIDTVSTMYFRLGLNMPGFTRFQKINIPEHISIIYVNLAALPNWESESPSDTVYVSVNMHRYFDSSKTLNFPKSIE